MKHLYRRLFRPKRRGKLGPKGPSPQLIQAIVETKTRNPSWGCCQIAQQLSLAFGIEIYKDIVRRVLKKHFHPGPNANGPSWLTVLGHTKDILWSVDLFRCESLILKSHWVLVAMDQFTRQIIGFGINAGSVDASALCRMFNQATRESGNPKYVSTDNHPLFLFHRWSANLRLLETTETKTVPHVPISHTFIERLIGKVRREFLNSVPIWSARGLTRTLDAFKDFYNGHSCHYAMDCDPICRLCENRVTRPGTVGISTAIATGALCQTIN